MNILKKRKTAMTDSTEERADPAYANAHAETNESTQHPSAGSPEYKTPEESVNEREGTQENPPNENRADNSKTTSGELPLVLVERGPKITGSHPMVKLIVAFAAIVAVYIGIVPNLGYSMEMGGSSFEIALVLMGEGLCLLLVAVAIGGAAGCREGKKSVAMAVTTAMLMVFANVFTSPSAVTVYYNSLIFGVSSVEFLLVCVTTFGAILASYYAILRENKLVYTISWLILIIVAILMIYYNAHVFNEGDFFNQELSGQTVIGTYGLLTIYYLIMLISLIVANPQSTITRNDIPEGYCPIFLNTAHERKSELLSSSVKTLIWCSLIYILSAVSIYTDEDLSTLKEFATYYLLIPSLILIIIGAIILKSEPRTGPASHAARCVPVYLIGLALCNLICHYSLKEIPGVDTGSYLSVYVLNIQYSDIFMIIQEYFEVTDFEVLTYAMIALLFISAAGMLHFKKYIRYISIIALVALTVNVMNTIMDIVRVNYCYDLLFSTDPSKLIGLTLPVAYIFGLLAMLELIGAIVTKCDYTQIRAETEPIIALDDLLHPKSLDTSNAAPQQEKHTAVPQPTPEPSEQPSAPQHSQLPNDGNVVKDRVMFCPGCGKPLNDLSSAIVFCPYCGRSLPPQQVHHQSDSQQTSETHNESSPMKEKNKCEVAEVVKYNVQIKMPKRILKGHTRYDHLEYDIGGQTYRGQIGKTRDIRINGGTYTFVFRQLNVGESPEGSEVSTMVTINGQCQIAVELNKDGIYEIVVS